jgi:hypothetical protein
VAIGGCGAIAPTPGPSQPGQTGPSPTATGVDGSPGASPGGGLATIYLHYYMWWTTTHWQEKLGAAFPYGAEPPPLPGTVDASGCSPAVDFPGATIVDLPSEGLYDQELAATFDHHIQTAAAAGITGFLVSWQGSGAARQDPSASGYDRRLALLVQRVDAFNENRAVKFRLGLAFASFGDYSRPADAVINDLQYFAQAYGSDPAFANDFSAKPIVMWLDSRNYSLATVTAVGTTVEPVLYLLGDETNGSWSRDAPFLDGTSYYWSSENPITNPSADNQLVALADQVRAAGKRWFAPFIAGFDKQLVGGGCVPRNGTDMLDQVWSANAASRPDGWFGISWNEFVENTYLEPSLRYGTTYLDEIRRLAGG